MLDNNHSFSKNPFNLSLFLLSNYPFEGKLDTFPPKNCSFSYLHHFWILPASDEVPVQVDHHQRAIPQPARFQAELRALHRVHSNRAKRFDRIHDQVAQLADLPPSRGWLLLLPLRPPPPPKEDDHGSGADHGRRHVREPRSVCSTKRSPINYLRSSDHAKRFRCEIVLVPPWPRSNVRITTLIKQRCRHGFEFKAR